jgi:DNA-binding SARP family transcriptional activator/predicted ATPase
MDDATGGVRVDFLVLGPLLVKVAGRQIVISSNNQRIVLAVLLMEAGRPVPISRLVDAIWNEAPPSTARNQVQACVSKLRKHFMEAGASKIIVTDPVGYRVCDPGESLDLRRFKNFVRSAETLAERDPAEAIRHYHAGMALWRGEAFAEIESRVIQPGALSLNEDRLAAYEACLDLELRLGRHGQVVGTLTELVARYPAHERFRAQLMLSLYRSGRQTEALEVFHTGREVKREEFGLDPGNELRALERAILAGDSVLDMPDQPPAKFVRSGASGDRWPLDGVGDLDIEPVPVPRQLPPAIADFTGRRGQLAQICRTLLPSGEDNPTRLVVLVGRGGVGKTALALQAAHAVRDAYPDGHLYAGFQHKHGSARNPSQILGGWLSTFGVAPAVVPEDIADRAAIYRSWLGGRRLLIVLDDVADAADVEPLLPGIPGCAVIVTSRKATIRLPGADRLNVGPLHSRLATHFLAKAIGVTRAAAEPTAVHGLVELCDGLPLALRIVGSKIADRPHWSVERMRGRLAYERTRLDELDLGDMSVRATLAFAHRNLRGGLRWLLARLVVLGATDFRSWVATVALDVDLDEAEDMLAELVSAQLLESRATHDGTVRYHLPDLVRLYVEEVLGRDQTVTERRLVLQRYLGCWLDLAQRAHAVVAGDESVVLHGLAPRWALPEQVIKDLLADPAGWFQDERENLRRAALLAARSGLDEMCGELVLASSPLFESGWYSTGWREVHEMALRVAEEAGNRLGTAALLYSLQKPAGQRRTPRFTKIGQNHLGRCHQVILRCGPPARHRVTHVAAETTRTGQQRRHPE